MRKGVVKEYINYRLKGWKKILKDQKETDGQHRSSLAIIRELKTIKKFIENENNN